MSAVLQSLTHLLLRSAQLLVSARSSSFSAVGLSILGFAVREVFAFYRSGWDWRAMRAKWAQNVKDGIMVVIGLWVVIFACSIVVTVYADHQDLLYRIRALTAEKENQATETQRKLIDSDKILSDAKKRIDELERQLDMEKGRKSGQQPSSAKLLFSFVPVEKGGQPVREITLPRVDGKVTFTFYVANQSGISALRGQIWFHICQNCKYTYGPEYFTTLPSAPPDETTQSFNQIFTNSHVAAKVGIAVPSGTRSFEVNLKYACETCESDPEVQRGIIRIGN